MTTLRAGAAAIAVDPPSGLPMSGVVRRNWTAQGQLDHLEVTALALERDGTRVILCGADTLAIQSPEVDRIRARIAEATGAAPAGILVNFSHTHHAPPGGRTIYGSFGERDPEIDQATAAYIDMLHERIVEVCALAFQRLEPAFAGWGIGSADRCFNRRARDADGKVRALDWHEHGLLDRSVTAMHLVRPDESVIGMLISYGAHTVTTGLNARGYSPDYVGPLRAAVRRFTGGECVFFMAAAGNVMPIVSFEDENTERRAMGEDIALQALHALGPRPWHPAELGVAHGFKSGTPVAAYRWHPRDGEPQILAAVEREVSFPLQALPTLEEIVEFRERSERELETAAEAGVGESELRLLRFHGVNWARRVEAELRSGHPRTSVLGSISAVRIGDGVIATGPGETFTEIGLAVKERSPAAVTLYAGYTNGCISYFPIASEYPLGGYEPDYGNKTYGLPAQVDPSCDSLLVQTAVELIDQLFDNHERIEEHGWRATGALPAPPTRPLHSRPTAA